MAQINVVYFFLVTWTVFSFSHSIPHPFQLQEQCAVKELDVNELVGEWHMTFHKDIQTTKNHMQMKLVGKNTLLTSFYEDGNLVNRLNLTQHEDLPGKLESLVKSDSWTMSIPIFVLSVQPHQYMTLYFSKIDDKDDWAIYSRHDDISEENYSKAIKGLLCLHLIDSNSEPLLHMM